MEGRSADTAPERATTPSSRGDGLAGVDAARAALIGAAGGVLLAFAAPQQGISHFMHEVLGLPGPGTGLGMMVGPWASFCCLAAVLLVQQRYTALVAGASFSLAYNVHAVLFPSLGPNPGMFGSLRFALGLVLLGAVAETVWSLVLHLSRGRRLALAAVTANLAFLAYSWIVVFPVTKGWVTPRDALVIAAASIPPAVVAGAGSTMVSLSVADGPRPTGHDMEGD